MLLKPPSEREVAFSQENDGRSERAQTNSQFVWVSDAIVARAPSAVTRSVLLPSLPEEGFRARSLPFMQIHKFDTFCLQSALPCHKAGERFIFLKRREKFIFSPKNPSNVYIFCIL